MTTLNAQHCQTCPATPSDQWKREPLVDGGAIMRTRTNRYLVKAWEVERATTNGHHEFANWTGRYVCRTCAARLSDAIQ